MVRVAIGLGVLLAATPVVARQSASGVDWRGAGGGLFVEAVAAGTGEEDASAPLEIARLAPLSQPFQTAIEEAAQAHGLDAKLLHALVLTESAYRPEVCSPAGACGLTQLMPGTALELQVTNRFDPVESLRGGADYLARQILRFGDLRLALAAYNAGPNRVARLGRVPDIAETQAYVATVIDCYLALSAGRGVTRSPQCRPREATP
ncbi:MAG: lytic transglycosylase domain-containing protein [Caulobacteraceae bacterium]|nr:lytic transglycosylase domain-containing protein [Caulobacteraceae bacterium]